MGLSTAVFLLLAVLAWGVGAFLDKLSLKYLDPAGAFYARALFNILLFAPLLAWKFHQTRHAMTGSGRLGPLLVGASVVITMSGVFFYLKALSGGEATRIVPLSSAYPVVTFALALAFLGEDFTAARLLGTLLLSGGVYFISR
ncbi:MAG: EamA family transporter [Elusimicrobia bacterium]|nr:EamA family transporter [Elusimicrobiota bacterium]